MNHDDDWEPIDDYEDDDWLDEPPDTDDEPLTVDEVLAEHGDMWIQVDGDMWVNVADGGNNWALDGRWRGGV